MSDGLASPGQGPPELNTDDAHSARVWNYLLGGKDNFGADRKTGELILNMFPGIAFLARQQRAFLVRAVRYLAGAAGVRQFLDIGTGLPTANNTHEVAQRIAPQARIVYVDNDPLVMVHARELLSSTPEGAASYIGVAPGSYLALCDGTDTSAALNEAIRIYNENSASSYHLRRPDRIAAFFDGLEMVPPGVTGTAQWRPDRSEIGSSPEELDAICGVGRKL